MAVGFGECDYGEFFYGGDGCFLGTFELGTEPNAKMDTHWLSKSDDGTISDLTDDVSQENLTGTGGTWHLYLTNSVFDRSHPRAVEVVLEALTSSETGWIFKTDDGLATENGLEIYNNGGTKTLRPTINGSTDSNGELAVPGLSGTGTNVVIMWTSRVNPATTGASDLVESTICAYNLDTDGFDKVVWAHADMSPAGGNPWIWLADDTSGATNWGRKIGRVLRFSERYHDPVEMREDFVEQSDQPATSAERETPPIALARSDGVADAGEIHGPAAVWAATAQRSMVRRTSYPLVNRRYRSVPTISSTTANNAPAWIDSPKDTSGRWHMYTGWFHPHRPVHQNCDRIWARFHLKTWVTSGASVPLGIRLYSMNKRPGSIGNIVLNPEDAEPMTPYYVQTVVDRDDTASGTGSYVTFSSLLPISRGTGGLREDKTYLALAVNIDPNSASGNDANARFEIAALHAVQLKSESGTGPVFTDFLSP